MEFGDHSGRFFSSSSSPTTNLDPAESFPTSQSHHDHSSSDSTCDGGSAPSQYIHPAALTQSGYDALPESFGVHNAPPRAYNRALDSPATVDVAQSHFGSTVHTGVARVTNHDDAGIAAPFHPPAQSPGSALFLPTSTALTAEPLVCALPLSDLSVFLSDWSAGRLRVHRRDREPNTLAW